jgi:hypothetical protein
VREASRSEPEQSPRRSEFGRQIAVDLKADANLDERRSGPSHWSLSLEAGITLPASWYDSRSLLLQTQVAIAA